MSKRRFKPREALAALVGAKAAAASAAMEDRIEPPLDDAQVPDADDDPHAPVGVVQVTSDPPVRLNITLETAPDHSESQSSNLERTAMNADQTANSLIAHDTAFDGSLEQSSGNLTVAGDAKGQLLVSAEGAHLDVAPSGNVTASVETPALVIRGNFDGPAKAGRIQARRATDDASADAPVHNAPATRFSAASDVSGDLRSDREGASVEICGKFKGSVMLLQPGTSVSVAAGAQVNPGSDITAHTITLAGNVDGCFTASGTLRIEAGASVQGTLRCPPEGPVIARGARVHAMLICGEPGADQASQA